MNVELQTLVDRLEAVERQGRTWRTTAVLALIAAAAGLVLATRSGGRLPDHARFSVIEANRILLRDLGGTVAGGLESTPDGTLRLVIGNASSASAHLVVRPEGVAELALRSRDGALRASVRGSEHPSVWLSPDGGEARVALQTRDDGTGEVIARDADGRLRFRAP